MGRTHPFDSPPFTEREGKGLGGWSQDLVHSRSGAPSISVKRGGRRRSAGGEFRFRVQRSRSR